jgi:hypothetical protein
MDGAILAHDFHCPTVETVRDLINLTQGLRA